MAFLNLNLPNQTDFSLDPAQTPTVPPPQYKEIAEDSLTPDEDVPIIAVMGPTGSGKSTFISKLATQEVGIGHGLGSHTQRPEEVPCKIGDKNIVLVDTPGFNDTNRSDTEILMSLVDWMQDCYQDRQLSGIIYLHDITQARMTGSSLTNLRMFRKLCGDENLKNVILATTKWAKPPKDVEVSREQELCTDKEFWGLMVKYGSKVRQFGNTTESAGAIVEKILNMGEEHFTPKIQQEVKQGKEIWDTDAGAFIDRALKEQARKHEEELRALVEEQNRALKKRKRAPKLPFKGKITVRADSYLDDQDMQAFLVEQQKVLEEKIKKREEEQRILHLNHLTEMEELLQKVKVLDRGENSEHINQQKLLHLNHLQEVEVLKRRIMTLEKIGEERKGEYINKQGAWRSSWKCLFCKRKNRSHGRWKCPDCNLQQNNITWEEAQKLKPSPAAIKTPPAI